MYGLDNVDDLDDLDRDLPDVCGVFVFGGGNKR